MHCLPEGEVPRRMARVLPHDVVGAIDSQLPWVKDWRNGTVVELREQYRFRARELLPGILQLIASVPEEFLVVLSSEERVRLLLADAALDEALDAARNNLNSFQWPSLQDRTDCLVVVREALEKCPAQVPSKSTQGLHVIQDEIFRESLLVDLRSAERALNAGEWKAATVLAGSIIEALLLWAIQRHTEAARTAAVANAVKSKRLGKPLQVTDLTAREWSLHPYIEVAYKLHEIKDRTANLCREAKYYRNLIHPAAAERDKEKSSRGKAYGALAAVICTIEDLEGKTPAIA
jgi:hypothetical protein